MRPVSMVQRTQVADAVRRSVAADKVVTPTDVIDTIAPALDRAGVEAAQAAPLVHGIVSQFNDGSAVDAEAHKLLAAMSAFDLAAPTQGAGDRWLERVSLRKATTRVEAATVAAWAKLVCSAATDVEGLLSKWQAARGSEVTPATAKVVRATLLLKSMSDGANGGSLGLLAANEREAVSKAISSLAEAAHATRIDVHSLRTTGAPVSFVEERSWGRMTERIDAAEARAAGDFLAFVSSLR